MNPYYTLPSLEEIYLEDSYVEKIIIDGRAIIFHLLAVLKEGHPFYTSPLKNEKYCYRNAAIIFDGIKKYTFIAQNVTPTTDAQNNVDLGNIDTFFYEGELYTLEGDWGKLQLYATDIKVQLR